MSASTDQWPDTLALRPSAVKLRRLSGTPVIRGSTEVIAESISEGAALDHASSMRLLRDAFLAESPHVSNEAAERSAHLRFGFAAALRGQLARRPNTHYLLAGGLTPPVRVEVRETAARMVSSETFLVGRAPECDIRPAGDATVSRLQLVVVSLPGGIVLIDAWSSGGTRTVKRFGVDSMLPSSVPTLRKAFILPHKERAILLIGAQTTLTLGPPSEGMPLTPLPSSWFSALKPPVVDEASPERPKIVYEQDAGVSHEAAIREESEMPTHSSSRMQPREPSNAGSLASGETIGRVEPAILAVPPAPALFQQDQLDVKPGSAPIRAESADSVAPTIMMGGLGGLSQEFPIPLSSKSADSAAPTIMLSAFGGGSQELPTPSSAQSEDIGGAFQEHPTPSSAKPVLGCAEYFTTTAIEETAISPEIPLFKVGDRIRLCGLQRNTELNGLQGVLSVFNSDRNRWEVKVEGVPGFMTVKHENLVPVERKPQPKALARCLAAVRMSVRLNRAVVARQRLQWRVRFGRRAGLLTDSQQADLEKTLKPPIDDTEGVQTVLDGLGIPPALDQVVPGAVSWYCECCRRGQQVRGWCCPFKHRFCYDCMLRLALDHPAPACPREGCGYRLGKYDLEDIRVPPARVEAFRIARLDEGRLLTADAASGAGVFCCPGFGCGATVAVSTEQRRRFICGCGAPAVCTGCGLSPYHYHARCVDVQPLRARWLMWLRGGRESYRTLQRRTGRAVATQQKAFRQAAAVPSDSQFCPQTLPASQVLATNTRVPRARISAIGGRAVRHLFTDCAFCDGGKRIVGPRFRCIHCPSFSVCLKCEPRLLKEHQEGHAFEIMFEDEIDWSNIGVPLSRGIRARIRRHRGVGHSSADALDPIGIKRRHCGTVVEGVIKSQKRGRYMLELTTSSGATQVQVPIEDLQPLLTQRQADRLLANFQPGTVLGRACPNSTVQA